MTNINCTENCLYQKYGKCTLGRVVSTTIESNSNCVYFTSCSTSTPNAK